MKLCGEINSQIGVQNLDCQCSPVVGQLPGKQEARVRFPAVVRRFSALYNFLSLTHLWFHYKKKVWKLCVSPNRRFYLHSPRPGQP